jgi:hypothetical protein
MGVLERSCQAERVRRSVSKRVTTDDETAGPAKL